MSFLSKSVLSIKPSATLTISQKARDLKAMGIDVISLSTGDPDFSTPENVKIAAIEAIRNKPLKYTAVSGILELRKAISVKLEKENNLLFSTEEIIVSTGGKQSLFNAFMASLNSDDEVIIPAPYWVSYPEMVTLCGGTPIPLQSSAGYGGVISGQDLRSAINKNTKWVILNSPSNPAGTIYSEKELLDLADVLIDSPHVWIISDDIYEHLIFDERRFLNVLNVCPALRERTVIINGVSKGYAMTGWRLGYAVAPAWFVQAMELVQGQQTSSPSTVSQWAAVEALSGSQSILRDYCIDYQRRRDMAVDLLRQVSLLNCPTPSGAFYVFPSCKDTLGLETDTGKYIGSDEDFVSALLEDYGVAVVPGSAFGVASHFRVTYAVDDDDLKNGCARISRFCNGLKSIG